MTYRGPSEADASNRNSGTSITFYASRITPPLPPNARGSKALLAESGLTRYSPLHVKQRVEILLAAVADDRHDSGLRMACAEV